MTISFQITKADRSLAHRCAELAALNQRQAVEKYGGESRSVLDWEMDLIATHANGNPLNFERLLAFGPFDFAHDIYGIAKHLDRETGKLGGFFSPRCSAIYHGSAA